MGDVQNGKKLFMRMCSMCHTVNPGGSNKMGPNLFGVIGRSSGTAPGFNFTEAMRNKGIKWDEKSLDQYLEFPRQYVPGTRMVFNGIKKAENRKDIIAYLYTLK